MHARHETKFLADGAQNPLWKPRENNTSSPKIHKTLFKFGRFVSWDGEGINVPPTPLQAIRGAQPQAYVLIANSAGDTWWNSKGFSTAELFELFCNFSRKNLDAINVGFVIGYDVEMWLKDLPREIMKKIMHRRSRQGYTQWREWGIKYIPRKEFSLVHFKNSLFPYRFNAKLGRKVPNIDGRFMLWDTWGFFQASLIKAIKMWVPKFADLPLIESGKARRGAFVVTDCEEMIRYNAAELRAHAEIMDTVREAITQAGLVLTRWDGVGSIAAALLKKHGVKKNALILRRNDRTELVPLDVLDAARYATFGARIEAIQLGHISSPLWNYDINSAYPYAATQLENIATGAWELIQKPSIDLTTVNPLSLYHIFWELSRAILAPFPVRFETGHIGFVSCGESWVYGSELAAWLKTREVFDWRMAYRFDILEAFIFHGDGERPFEFIKETYDRRQVANQEGRAGESMVLKLGMNAVTGKLGQKAGYDPIMGKLPPYHCLPYFGAITAYTRAMLWEAVAGHHQDIVAFMTDGILSRVPLALPVSTTKELGKWEETQYSEGILIQPGMRYLRKNGAWSEKSRGIERVTEQGEMTARVERVLNTWACGEAKVVFPTRRFVGSRQALVSDEWWQTRACWITGKREIDVHPHSLKRDASLNVRMLSDGLQQTHAPFNFRAGDGLLEKCPLPWDGSEPAEKEEYRAIDEDALIASGG